MALGLSACGASVRGTVDAAGVVDAGVSPPLHHESYRASTGFAATQGAQGGNVWYYRQFDGASYSDMTWDGNGNLRYLVRQRVQLIAPPPRTR